MQAERFPEELSQLKHNKPITNKSILSLNPFLDTDGLIRVGERLSNAQIQYNQKHPVLLPSKNHLVTLLLKKEHVRLGHAGAQTVLSNIRLEYWPLDALREIKRIIRNCGTCFRYSVQPCQQLMADLPKSRICPARPFQLVGVDYAGPFFIKSSRLKRAPIQKCYAAIFICMTTKAIHIEVVSDLTSQAFLATLKRFISRRGNPTSIFSDNGSNFLGARNKLKKLYDFFQNEPNIDSLNNYLSSLKIQWKLIPPRSPHWGGLWESAVKSTKYHLVRIVGSSNLTFEELSTVFCQIEAILNSRPISALSSDPTDLECLTPGHFLIGTSLSAFPERDIVDKRDNQLSFWQRCSKMQQQFWNRWSKDYLNRLQNRPKWLKSRENLKVGELVLLKEDHVPPLTWSRARVEEVITGADGKVRVVKLRVKNNVLTRAITKLCPLPPALQPQDNSSTDG